MGADVRSHAGAQLAPEGPGQLGGAGLYHGVYRRHGLCVVSMAGDTGGVVEHLALVGAGMVMMLALGMTAALHDPALFVRLGMQPALIHWHV